MAAEQKTPTVDDLVILAKRQLVAAAATLEIAGEFANETSHKWLLTEMEANVAAMRETVDGFVKLTKDSKEKLELLITPERPEGAAFELARELVEEAERLRQSADVMAGEHNSTLFRHIDNCIASMWRSMSKVSHFLKVVGPEPIKPFSEEGLDAVNDWVGIARGWCDGHEMGDFTKAPIVHPDWVGAHWATCSVCEASVVVFLNGTVIGVAAAFECTEILGWHGEPGCGDYFQSVPNDIVEPADVG